MEVFGDVVMRYYLAELPVIPIIMRKRFRYYENIVNWYTGYETPSINGDIYVKQGSINIEILIRELNPIWNDYSKKSYHI